MAAHTHTCPAPGCEEQVINSQLACRSHWYALPALLRENIWRFYREHNSAAHRAAVREAVKFWSETVAAR